jgi:heme exporter protein C
MIWGKATWNVYWTWDARLTLTAIMLFVYIGYVALRRAIPDPEARARRSAVLGILGLVQLVPVHFSVTWWRTLHQTNTFRPRDIQMDGPILAALLVSVAGFTVVYAALLKHRVELARLELESLEAAVAADGPVAGDAVSAPTIGSGN